MIQRAGGFMQKRQWIVTPDDETLSHQENWRSLGNYRYSACRFHLLISGKRDQHAQNGPSFTETEIPSRATYNWSRKRAETIKCVTTLETSVKRTITDKTASEVSSKIASEIGISTAALTTKLQGEVQSKISVELVESVERELAQTNSYEVQNTDEIVSSISLSPSGTNTSSDPLNLYFFLKVWPWRWDVYLHKIEYLQLEYRRWWYWWQIRDTIVEYELRLRLPLFQIVYYEPDTWPSLRERAYEPDIADITIGVVLLNSNGYPRASDPEATNLQDLARLGFPASRQERKHARKAVKAKKQAIGIGLSEKRKEKQLIKRAAKKTTKKTAVAKKSIKKGAAAKRPLGRKGTVRKASTKKAVSRISRRK
jgi:hypothetical protein